MGKEILNTKDYVQRYKDEIQDELNKQIRGCNLYYSTKGKVIFKGRIIKCFVKCFKEYLQYNTVAIDIVTDRGGERLTVATLAECLHSEDVGYDYFITKEEER